MSRLSDSCVPSIKRSAPFLKLSAVNPLLFLCHTRIRCRAWVVCLGSETQDSRPLIPTDVHSHELRVWDSVGWNALKSGQSVARLDDVIDCLPRRAVCRYLPLTGMLRSLCPKNGGQ